MPNSNHRLLDSRLQFDVVCIVVIWGLLMDFVLDPDFPKVEPLYVKYLFFFGWGE